MFRLPRAIALAMLTFAGCAWDGLREGFRENLAPTVRITGGAVENADADYRVKFFWFGSDPDGTIAFFLYAIDDTCLCEYEVEELVPLPAGGTETIGRTIKSFDADSCRSMGIEPAYESPDSIWKRVEGFSGTFLFDATTPIPDSRPPSSSDWHAFYIKAVDNQAGESRVDTRFFNAVTIAPTVALRAPTGQGVSKFQTVSTFLSVRWDGRDEDATNENRWPVGYQLKLVKLNSIFDPDELVLSYVRSPFAGRPNLLIPDSLLAGEGDAPTASTFEESDWWPKADEPYPHRILQLQNLISDNYAFAVRAVDQAGAITPDRTLLISDPENGGSIVKLDVNAAVPLRPVVTVRERSLLGTHAFLSSSDVWHVEVPVNVPLWFEWSLDTSHYGARPGASNFALDIPDPGCDVCIENDGIGGWIGWGNRARIVAPIVFGEEDAGERHVLFIRARDESFSPERETIATVVMDVIVFAFDRTALLVDDFKASSVDDCEHDALKKSLVGAAVAPFLLEGDELGLFDSRDQTGECQESSVPRPPSLSTLSRYRAVFWNVGAQVGGTALGQLTTTSTQSSTGRYLSIYVRAGGNLFVWGRSSIGALLGDRYPNDVPYIPELPRFERPNFGPGTFVFDVMKLRTLIDRVGRGNAGSQLQSRCSGLVGLEATRQAIEDGYPVGIPDPTGYDPSRSAIWFDDWMGFENPRGEFSVNGFLGSPKLRVAGLDTLYTHVSNSWSYASGGSQRLREACGVGFLSPFEGQPAVIRYRDFSSFQGRIVWMGTPIHRFQSQRNDLSRLFSRVASWLLTGRD